MADPYRYVVNISKDFMTLIRRDYVYEIVNDAYCAAMQKSREAIVGRTVSEVWGQETFRQAIQPHLDECFQGKEVEYIERFRFGPFEKHMHVTYYPYPGRGAPTTHVAVCSHDITDLARLESRLSHYEFRDPTTGLFNRRAMDVILAKEIEQAKRGGSTIRAVLFVSVQNLGRVNEVYGMTVGDLVIQNTGLKIQQCLRSSDFVFRVVGNEITCLLPQISRSADAAHVAEKIVEQVTLPYRHEKGEIRIGCAVGIALYPADGETAEDVIRHAASAMREAVRRQAPFLYYNPAIHREATERLHLESDMLHAFEEEQYRLAYQPIVGRDGRIAGAEALIRWDHPVRGHLSPAAFIPLAEQTGIVRSISKWALFAAAEHLGRLGRHEGFYVTVNLSAADFALPDLPEILESALARYGVKGPERLKLEITESQCLVDPATSMERMARLAARGFEIYIDDFGTGSSSLAYLKRLPAAAVKVDRMFVEECTQSEDDYRYLESISNLARSRGKRVIFEGVGTASLYERTRVLEPDGLQGFHFSKPLAADELDRLLDQGLPLPQDPCGGASSAPQDTARGAAAN